MGTLRLTDQDPDEVLDHILDWEDALGGDTIISAIWVNFPEGELTLTSQSNTTLLHAIRITVGTAIAGSEHVFTSEVITSGGETVQQRVRLRIRNG